MKIIIRNILAVIAGLIIGSVINMAIIVVGGMLIPPLEGIDMTDVESLQNNMHLFEAKHFITPFLAHALGTFVGAFITLMVAASHEFKLAYVVAVLFLIGGIANVMMLPSPMWFNVVDLVFAYIPMAFLATFLSLRVRNKKIPYSI